MTTPKKNFIIPCWLFQISIDAWWHNNLNPNPNQALLKSAGNIFLYQCHLYLHITLSCILGYIRFHPLSQLILRFSIYHHKKSFFFLSDIHVNFLLYEKLHTTFSSFRSFFCCHPTTATTTKRRLVTVM